MVKLLTVLVSKICNSQVFLLKKKYEYLLHFNVNSFCKNAKATHIFSAKNISVYAIFNDQSFNNMLTNDVSFKQLGPDVHATSILTAVQYDNNLSVS